MIVTNNQAVPVSRSHIPVHVNNPHFGSKCVLQACLHCVHSSCTCREHCKSDKLPTTECSCRCIIQRAKHRVQFRCNIYSINSSPMKHRLMFLTWHAQHGNKLLATLPFFLFRLTSDVTHQHTDFERGVSR